MRELTKSIGSFSWALSLFGVRQMANAMNPKRAEEAFDHVTTAAEGELGDFLRSAFQMGDQMQRGFVDMTLGMFSAASLDPGSWGRTLSDMTSGATRAMSGMMPGAGPPPTRMASLPCSLMASPLQPSTTPACRATAQTWAADAPGAG